MNWGGAELTQLLHVIVGAVALVLREAVAGILLVVGNHHAIAGDFRDDRRGRDAEALAIATDYSRLRQLESGNEAPVNQHVTRGEAEGGESALARLHRGPIDVEAIDLEHARRSDADRDRVLANRDE